jgi:hypothetical protein
MSPLLEGYFSCSKLHNTLAIPLISYPKNTLGSITYFSELGRVTYNPTNMGKIILV